jgi:uncharacterized protein
MMKQTAEPLAEVAPTLAIVLTRGADRVPLFPASEVRRATVRVTMRDGVHLATDLYLPPRRSAPAIALRTPYGRADAKLVDCFVTFARHGYIVISQDCRGTGDSEPDTWDYYVYEREDSFDLIEWITTQEWFDGFVGACGGSYVAQTQWCMAFHPRMSTIVPEVGGLGIAHHTARLYMFLNAYSRSVGKGADKAPISFPELERQMLDETLAGGYFNEPLDPPLSAELLERYPATRGLAPAEARRWLWRQYCESGPKERADFIKRTLGESSVTAASVEALSSVFGQHIAHDAHMFPTVQPSQLCRSLHAPALMVTGWFDWGLNDALATWESLQREAGDPVRSRSRLLITPGAHNTPGYHEGHEDHPELQRTYRTTGLVDLLLCWYASVRNDGTDSWPAVIYYLMGANEWHCAPAWPLPQAHSAALHLGPDHTLTWRPPQSSLIPDSYTYRPDDPTPTLGGNIVSYVYIPGSADVSEVQKRADVLTYTSAPLEEDLDVVGPLRLILYASSSAVDTDFAARLSDVFPDGRAIQLQSVMLRARYRNPDGDPQLLEPERVYRLEIDLWATANRFRAGHCLRLDISSANFPKFDRNTNCAGARGGPMPAVQKIYHGADHPSHLVLSVLGRDVSAR